MTRWFSSNRASLVVNISNLLILLHTGNDELEQELLVLKYLPSRAHDPEFLNVINNARPFSTICDSALIRLLITISLYISVSGHNRAYRIRGTQGFESFSPAE
jgi:hypothetical protein